MQAVYVIANRHKDLGLACAKQMPMQQKLLLGLHHKTGLAGDDR